MKKTSWQRKCLSVLDELSITLSHPVWLEHRVLECGYRDEQKLSDSN